MVRRWRPARYRELRRGGRVHRELGCGFLEAVYQEALGKEFETQGIPFRPQPIVKISYKGKPLNKIYQPDFVCYEEIIARPPRLSELRN